MNARRRVAIVAILCVAGARSAAVAAQPARVAVAPAAPGEDPTIVQALNRLRFELADVGFAAPDPDHGQPADYVVGIARVGVQVVVSVSVGRPGAPNAVLRSVALSELAGGGSDEAATLAIRAVEILRATILQAGAAGEPAKRPTSPAVPVTLAARPSSEWALGAGPGLLQSFHGFGTGWGLSAHAALRPRPWLSLELAASAPILQPDLRAPAGSATVQQETFGAGIRCFFRASHRVRPAVSLSGGVYHVSVDGHALSGTAVSSGLTAPFAAAAAGVMLARGESLALQLQAQALFVQRAPFVIIGHSDAGHAGRPLLLVALEIEWRRAFGSRTIR